MAPKKQTFEVFFVIEASSSDAARRASDRAWQAFEEARGCTPVLAFPRSRSADGKVADVEWSGWDEEVDVALRVHYEP